MEEGKDVTNKITGIEHIYDFSLNLIFPLSLPRIECTQTFYTFI